MSTLTVRINPACHAKLREIAKETREPMTVVLEKAIEEYRRLRFLRRVNAEFALLRRNKSAWKQELKERAAWDATLSDGLEND
jgi:predicted transcriptional regulator